ncbi:putative membrane protein [Selenomonas sp. FOBRC6]|uniref:hypothetical protein n=1 Tax=Selenomonas sp. FOBRC6 TaxID=936572 RepID=UPI000277EFE1|nr:hypothetical protein [Selenomonas sp. FOBRC6]EJO23042.1 putative membrane protein [Selenomonas sp. FOBRC6]
MTFEKNNALTALSSAFVLVSVAALTLVLTASLCARAGLPFASAYTAGVIACIIGTLAVSRGGRTLIALPSPAIISWLVYEEIIAKGLAWQELLGIAAVVAIIGAVFTRTKYAAALMRAVPPIIRTGLVIGLGLVMLVTAALYARILLPSPWALTMGGTLSDPLTYFTLTGILLVLVLSARSVRAALPLGMLLIGVLTWAEGFWEIPAAPFYTPDLSVTFALTLPQAEPFAVVMLGVTLLLALMIETMAVLTVRTHEESTQPLTRLFAVSSAASFIGAFPLTIAPISLAVPEKSKERRRVGMPMTALFSALLLLVLLPCAPLMQALADFPAAPAIALAATGLLLLARGVQMLHSTEDVGLREGAVLAVFLLASYDIATGLTLTLILWTLLTAASSQKIARGTWGLTAFFAVFALLKWVL